MYRLARVFFILSQRNDSLLLAAKLQVCANFGIEMNIHFVFIKNRKYCASFAQCFMDCFLHQASFVTGNWCYDRHRSVRLVVCFFLAIVQIAQSGLSSLKVIYNSAQLFSWGLSIFNNKYIPAYPEVFHMRL